MREVRAGAPGVPATAARRRSCETRPPGASGVTVSVLSTHSEGARDVGAVDPPCDMESENPELRDDGADKDIEDVLSRSSTRDVRC